MLKHIKSIDNHNDFLERIIKYALDFKASDIHITPLKEKILVRFRVGEDIISFCTFTHEDNIKLANIIKISCNMDINEILKPQDGKYILEIKTDAGEISVSLRVSTFPSLYGENIVMRVAVNSNKAVGIDELWFQDIHTETLKKITQLNSWLVLVAWETGSGKTSTLYSLLRTFDPFEQTIYTLEDPIEYVVDGFVQSEVKHKWENNQEKYSFKKWLVWLLRQDPDIILIWEIRDTETASISLESANTWHLIFWSIHANDGLAVITRLQQLWIENYLISNGLKYIVFQKLIKKLCPHCKKQKTITINDYNKSATGWEQKTVYVANPDGCKECYKGHKWLQLIWEIIKIDDNVAQMIYTGKSSVEIKKYLKDSWSISLFQDAFQKAQLWIVSFDEILPLRW